jgi:AbrB family transcriptional regulator, transcriptional pleiotropic regulator of transition state genes
MPARGIGMSRRVDDLGRIVLPAELRRTFDIREGDELEIAVDGDQIILEKRRTSCTFCGGAEDLRTYRDHPVCPDCLGELRRI